MDIQYRPATGLDAVALQLLLQLADADARHVQLVPHLPEVRITDGIVTAVVADDVLGLVHGAAERQGLAHALQMKENQTYVPVLQQIVLKYLCNRRLSSSKLYKIQK